jgi:ribose transport system ATP-binding protein
MGDSNIILRCERIVKKFPGLVALNNVDFEIREGEIRALVGENGAGKSTLVKIITGVYRADSGTVSLRGEKLLLHGPQDALAKKIAIIHQDPNVVAQLSVWQNVFLNFELTGPIRLMSQAKMRRKCTELLSFIDADFDADDLAQDLSIAQHEQVAICAALVREPSILILDEPTAVLTSKEIAKLFDIIRMLKGTGVTVIYISHHLGEIFELADSVTVLRDGEIVGTKAVREVDREDIIRMMIGRDLEQLYPKTAIPLVEKVLEVRHLACEGKFQDVSMEVGGGEIVGICGLIGSGRAELARALFGAEEDVHGEILVHGKRVDCRSPEGPREAGIAYVPEDRRSDGLIGNLSVRENLSIANLDLWSKLGFVNRGKESSAVKELISSLSISTVGPEQEVSSLSGGNQQKVVIGKWLSSRPDVFVLNEPTVGVDVGAKVEIYRQMTDFARVGGGVVFVSSDFEELIGMCDRIFVMVKGRIVKVLERAEFSQEALLYWATSSSLSPEPSKDASATEAEARHRKPKLSVGSFLKRWGTISGMILLVIACSIASPRFLAFSNIFDILKQGSVLSLIALGLTIALISGGFDMSVGALSQLTSNLSAGLIAGGLATSTTLLVGGAAGLGVGALNALFVVLLRMPPFVATLGTMFALMGVTLAYNHGQSFTLANQPIFFSLGQGYIGPIPIILVIVVGLLLILRLFLKRTRAGLHMYAVGGNPQAATVRGLNKTTSTVLAFMLGGLIVGLAGVILTSYSYGASAVPASLDFLISALAAAFLGTTFNRAGQLDVLGTVVAAMFIAAINNGLILNGVSNLALPGIQGLILVLSILPSVIRKKGIGQVTIF